MFNLEIGVRYGVVIVVYGYGYGYTYYYRAVQLYSSTPYSVYSTLPCPHFICIVLHSPYRVLQSAN